MLILAAAQSGEAVSWFVLAASCFATALLLRRPPERRVPDSTPHNIPWLAMILATLWMASIVLLPAYLAARGEPAQETVSHLPEELDLKAIGIVGLEGILTTAVMFLAIEIPRLARDEQDDVRPAEELTPSQPVPEPAAPPPLRSRFLTEVGYGALVGLSAILATTLVGFAMEFVRTREEIHPFLELLVSRRSWLTLLVVSISAVLIAPLKEELIFRVIFQGWLVDRLGGGGILVTAILFASVHQLDDLPLLIPLALMLGILYERRRSYVAVVAAHAIFNAANILMAVAVR